MRNCGKALAAVLIAVAMGGVLRAQTAGPAGPAAAYRLLLQREAALRVELDGALAAAAPANLLKRMRAITVEYEQLSKKYRTSGYSDNALWQGAVLAGDAFARFGYSADRRTARRLMGDLAARFPASSLVAGIAPYRDQLNRSTPPATRPASAATPKPPATSTTKTASAAANTPLATTKVASVRQPANTLTDLRRDVLSGAVRLTLLLDRETTFTSERPDNASRVQIDLRNTQVGQALRNARLTYPDDLVRQVRVVPTDAGHARITLDLERGARFSVYPVYGPYRLIVDVEREAARPATPAAPPASIPLDRRSAPRLPRPRSPLPRRRARSPRPRPSRCRRRPAVAATPCHDSLVWARRASSSTPGMAVTTRARRLPDSTKPAWSSTWRCASSGCCSRRQVSRYC